MKEKAKVLIYGAGAVGSVLGWRLAQSNKAVVSVVCRSNYDVIRHSGYSLRTKLWGNGLFRPHRVYNTAFLRQSPQVESWDFIICATKITDEDCSSTVRDLQALVGQHTMLVSAQNGMNVEQPMRDHFPRNTILSAICNISVRQPQPGLVEQVSCIQPHAFHIGVHSAGIRAVRDGNSHREYLASIDKRFISIDCVMTERWRKLIFNNAWNHVAALADCDTHQLFERPGAIAVVLQLAKEACQVASRSGVQIPQDFPQKVIETAYRSPPIIPSTLQDVRSGRPLELAPMSGYLITQARKVGVAVPYTKMVHTQLQNIQRQNGSAASVVTSRSGTGLWELSQSISSNTSLASTSD